MWRLLVCLLVALPAARAAQPAFVAEVTGNVIVERTNDKGETTFVTERINNARIYRELGVSPDDYEVVSDPSDDLTVLKLVPRQSLTKLPTLPVINTGDKKSIYNTKLRIGKVSGNISAAQAATSTSLFGVLGGGINITTYYAAPTSSDASEALIVRKMIVTIQGHGVNPLKPNAAAIIGIRVTTGKKFVPVMPSR